MLIFGGYDTKPGKYPKVTLLVIIALRSSSGLVLNGKIMYIKATSHCLIRYQSIVGELCTIQSEDKFTQSLNPLFLDNIVGEVYNVREILIISQ